MYFIATYGVSEGATASTVQNLAVAALADVLLFLSATVKILNAILFLYLEIYVAEKKEQIWSVLVSVSKTERTFICRIK